MRDLLKPVLELAVMSAFIVSSMAVCYGYIHL